MPIKRLFLTSTMLVTAAIAPKAAIADSLTTRLAEEVCTVEGVETIRTPRYNESPEASEIMALERETCQAVAKQQFEKLGREFLHTHGIILLDRGPVIQGAKAQVQMFADYIGKRGLFLTYEPAEAHVSEAQDMAWAIGLVKIQFPGQEIEIHKYVSIWEKENGRWKNVVEMRNPNQP